MNVRLEALDWVIIGIYFVVLFAIAIWVIRRRKDNTEDYFLAGRNAGWFVVGASIFASNIGSEHVVGLAGTGAESGMPMAHFELHAWIVLLLGWVFLPFYVRSGVFTMPEFLEKRFNSTARWWLSIISLIGYVLTKVSVSVYAGGIVIEALTGLDFWTGALITVIITGLYTVLGGMRAVIYTETLQTIVLIVGSLLVTVLGLMKIGGWSELKSIAGSSHFNMWRPSDDPDFPWTGLVFGGSIVGIWYWCTDQYIVQRTLAAKNIKVGLQGSIFGAYLKLTPVFLFLVPGIIAYALNKTGQLQLESSDQALPTLMAALLPTGIRGVVAAGLLAALMSSLASVFNSCSTLFTVDIYKKLHPGVSEKKLVNIGRIATFVVVILGILWIPVMANISGVLYEYLQSVQAYIAPPVTATFLLGIFWKRINSKGALATLIGGFVLGMSRLIAELKKDSLTGILHDWATINFLHFCVLLFVICVIICITVSLLSAAPDAKKIEGLTYGTLSGNDKISNRNRYGLKEIFLSIGLIVIIIWILTYFTG
ncbi:sodium:solute symporter [Marinigracilibium pacificum]|uniref:Sodium/solute symporter n=1 Tax=Marinigracilibium pacificum TaxID=2729599 RepID=A0A848IZ30_9BACT|nr:sodium:solute symporter [Marinigracilibium pacificum]NMM47550.1 sodium/solute symporter [Marinigracilibium pacificum]